MFSGRSAWDRTPNPIARLLEEKRAHGRTVLDLTESNPTRCGFEYPEAEIRGALSDPRGMTYEPDPRGLLEAREAVARYYADLGAGVSAGRIVLAASTSEGYSFLFRLLADSGDDVLVPTPSYPLFDFLSELDDVRTRSYALAYDGAWHIDLPSVRAAVGPRTRALVAVSPHNPTGEILKGDELEALESIAAGAGIALICDEVFADYREGTDRRWVATTAGDRRALTFTLGGLSKVVGLPQLKLGWICVSGPDDLRKEAIDRLEVIADTYLSVSTAVQLATPALLAGRGPIQRQIRSRIAGNRDHLVHAAQGAPWQVLHAEGGWCAVLRVPLWKSEEEWVLSLLRDRDVLVHPGFFFDFPTSGYLVVSLLPPASVFREGTQVLAEAFSSEAGGR